MPSTSFRQTAHILLTCLTGLAVCLSFPAVTQADSPAVDFVRDIQPILNQHCSQCHGSSKQSSGLRLDLKARAFAGGENFGKAILPGQAESSPLYRVVAGLEEGMKMPPEGEGEPLSEASRNLLKRWIQEGANWPDGVDKAQAEDRLAHWAFQPLKTFPNDTGIDSLIDASLKNAGLQRSPETDRRTLIRRLTLNLHGLLPTPEEVDAFIADDSPQAVERLIDRLLESPRYGERMARHWLDVIAFGETDGFEVNTPRENAWPYRDYVIEAFNKDIPYPQFIREQLAGDASGIDAATGFIVASAALLPGQTGKDEESRLRARQDELNDMVAVTGGAFLGLTLHCARCHDHKFDPVSQTDYFGLQAIFAGVRHGERPLRTNRPSESETLRAQLRSRIAALSLELGQLDPLSQPGSTTPKRAPVNAVRNVEHVAPVLAVGVRFTTHATANNNQYEPCIDELEVYSVEGQNVALARSGATVSSSGNYPHPKHQLPHINDGLFGNEKSWISNMIGKGWVEIRFARAEQIQTLVWGRDRHLKYADRMPVDYHIEAILPDDSRQVIASSSDRLPPGDLKIATASPASDASAQQRILSALVDLEQQLPSAQADPMVYAGRFETAPVMHRLHRGDVTQKREAVGPSTVSALRPALQLPADLPEQARRLALAEWLADPSNPLPARVMVNRIWQAHFGEGLVSTPNDFGRNGARPTHPELLDWLAGEFIRNGWSLKSLHKQILLSQTFRQSSTPREEALAIDAQTRLYWRFPPRRLEAEPIRDTILQTAGSLDLRMGGRGFSVFAPNNNYVRVYDPKAEFGPGEWRRAIYMTKVRVAQDATFGSFDCPDAGQPQPKRPRSTTPLQALNLFNSPFILQQADLLAERLKKEAPASTADQVRHAFRLLYQRMPDADELEVCCQLVEAQGLSSLGRVLLNTNEFLFLQ